MKRNQTRSVTTKKKRTLPHPASHLVAAVDAVAGTVAGGLLGTIGGPAGVIAGAALGAAAGAAAGAVAEEEAEAAEAHDHELDDAIGVTRGDLGAARKNAPPSRIGAFSSGSSGAGRTEPTPAEGPIPPDPD